MGRRDGSLLLLPKPFHLSLAVGNDAGRFASTERISH